MAKRPFYQKNQVRMNRRRASNIQFGALLVALLLFSMAALWNNSTAWAAPHASTQYQTVPKPTEEPTNTPVPTATPRKDDNKPSPTNTPKPQPTPAPTTPASATPASTTESPESGLTGIVEAVVLNVREGPGTAFGVIGTVTKSSSVEILERNAEGTWWHICCIANTETTGWVSAQFITPDFEASRANELIPLADALPAQPAPVEAAATTPALQLEIGMQPGFVWPGQELTLDFAITNLSGNSMQNVRFSDELSQVFEQVTVVVNEEGAAISSVAANGNTLVEATWSEVAAGATVNVTVTLRIADTLADGDVVDNLAVVGADDADDITAGISIGMPPTTLPDFK